MKKLLGMVAVFLLFAGCDTQSSKPEELIDEETYERMFIEFALINQLDERLKKNRPEEELRQMVYDHYGVTREQFRLSHQYYEQNIDDQLKRVNKMTQSLKTERDTLVVIEREFKAAIRDNKLDSLRQSFSGNE